MKYEFEMGSGAMTYKPSFIKIGSGHSKVNRRGFRDTRQHGDHKSLLSFF
jgi:hypothetical protein